MDYALIWRNYFASWPKGLSQTGVLITASEQIPFISFLLSEHVLMLERPAPDTVGARKLVIPYCKIEAIKVTEPVGNEVFAEAGFVEVESK